MSVHVEKPGLGTVVVNAGMKAGIGAAVVSLLYFGIKLGASQTDSSAAVVLGQSGQLLALVWIPLFAFFLIASSRVWADRAFTIAGFTATFLGLAILGVFFAQLAEEVVLWFHYTPILIEQDNERHRQTIEAAKEIKKTVQDALEAKRKSRDAFLAKAKTEEEKQEVRELFDDDIKELEENLRRKTNENVIIAESRMRPDTSAPTIFWYFLTSPTDQSAQDSGVGPALWGSFWLSIITIVFAVPIGVGAALYLEEYRQEGWIARVIQININNLAGVPSVVYGILGGFVFVYFFREVHAYRPEVSPSNLLGGGLTLGLLTLPMIIVSSQEAIRAVPSSLRHGALALGATKWQVIWTIVLPAARPGILTGTILSLSRAIGEAAPLVLFGAQQYVDRNPSLFSKFTALPLQIYQWTGMPAINVEGHEESIDIWKYNAALASTVLLILLLGLNAIAIFLRNRAQRNVQY